MDNGVVHVNAIVHTGAISVKTFVTVPPEREYAILLPENARVIVDSVELLVPIRVLAPLEAVFAILPLASVSALLDIMELIVAGFTHVPMVNLALNPLPKLLVGRMREYTSARLIL